MVRGDSHINFCTQCVVMTQTRQPTTAAICAIPTILTKLTVI